MAILGIGLVGAGLFGGVGHTSTGDTTTGSTILAVALGLIVVLATVTVIQRIMFVVKQSDSEVDHKS